MSKYKFRIGLGFLFIICSNLFAIFPARIIRETFNIVEQKIKAQPITNSLPFLPDMENYSFTNIILFFGAIVFALALTKGFFTFLTRQTIIYVSRLIEFDLKNEIFNQYLSLDKRFYLKNKTGDIMNRISDDVSKVRMYLGPGLMYSMNMIVLFTLVIYQMVSINIKLTLFSLLPLPVLSLIIYFVSNYINKQSNAVQIKLSHLNNLAQETFSGIRTIKAFVKRDTFTAKMYAENESYLQTYMKLVKTNAVFHPTIMLLIGLSTILTIYIGGKEVMAGNLRYGHIAEFIIYVNMLSWPVIAIGWVTSIIQQAAASQERINHFLLQKSALHTGKNTQFKMGKLSFKNVTYSYPNTKTPSINNLSFDLPSGKTLAITGKTGSGKSTLASLILHLYNATEGNISIAGTNINEYAIDTLRQNLSFVPQDNFLFSDTIKNNIGFGNPNASEKEIIHAAKAADVHENILTLKEQYDTLVGERGVALSGGQKQRIAIARALLKNPNILILDDCLSAVDTKTENHILSSLKEIQKDKTTVIISHRISTIKHADLIIVLDEGKIIEQGNHDELLENNGYYFDTYEKQLMEE